MNLLDVNLHFYTAISLQALNKVCRNKWFVPTFILNLQKTAFLLRLSVIVFNYECVCMDTGMWVQTSTETARGIGQSWAGVAEVVSHLTWVLGANSGPPSEQWVFLITEHLSSPGRHFQAFIVKLDLYQRALVQEFKNSTPISYFFSN